MKPPEGTKAIVDYQCQVCGFILRVYWVSLYISLVVDCQGCGKKHRATILSLKTMVTAECAPDTTFSVGTVDEPLPPKGILNRQVGGPPWPSPLSQPSRGTPANVVDAMFKEMGFGK